MSANLANITNLMIVQGDLLEMPIGEGHYMVQQCCCSGTVVAGLSSAIAKKWPGLHPYKGRVPIGRTHRATEESCDEPGTCEIFKDKSGAAVACLYGQVHPGKASSGGKDSREARLQYFTNALRHMAFQLNAPYHLYIPYGIGCGLAGGNWADYYKVLCEFAATNSNYNVYLVKKD